MGFLILGFYNRKSAKNEPKIRDFQNLHIHVKQESVPPMGVLDSSCIKALGVKSAGLKKIFLFFSGHPTDHADRPEHFDLSK